MGRLVLPSRWTQQPQGAVGVDPSHPLAGRVHRAFNFSASAGTLSCVASGASPTLSAHAQLTTGGLYVPSSTWAEGPTTLPVSLPPTPVTLLYVKKRVAGTVDTGFFSATWTGIYSQNADNVISTSGADFTGSVSPVSGASVDGYSSLAITMSGANDLRASLNGGAVASDVSCSNPFGSVSALRLGSDFDGGNQADVYVRLVVVILQAVTNAELIGLSANPWQIFRPLTRRIYFDLGAGGGTPNISPSGIASVEAFGSATVSRSSVQSIAATGIASAETFGGATIARTSVQAVSATGIASEEAFGAATVARTSVQSVTTAGIASAEAFGTATVARSSVQTVAPTGIASAEAFGTHTITLGGVVVPQGIPSAEAFGTATLTRTSVQSVSATGIASGEAFGSATVTRTSAQSIVVSGIASGEAFGSATFVRIGQGVVAPQGIASAEAFGTAAITRTSVKTVVATGIASSEAFGAPIVSIPGERTLTAQDLADIADAVWAHPKALTIARFLGLK